MFGWWAAGANSTSLGTGYRPLPISWSSHEANLRKKLWKRVAVLARIKKFPPVNCRIILFNASIKPILEYCVSVWGNCNAGLLDEIFKVQKGCVRIIPCHYFWNLGGYPSIKSVLKEYYLCSRKSWMDMHRISSLRNCYLWNTTSLMIEGLGCLIDFLFHARGGGGTRRKIG